MRYSFQSVVIVLFLQKGFLAPGMCEGDVGENNVCLLAVDSGSACAPDTKQVGKLETRFYYSVTNLKCSQFPFWGCGGNGNNFKSEELCMAACGNETAVYWQKIKAAMSSERCWYKNKLYSPGEAIAETRKDSACAEDCSCRARGDGQARINCAIVDCPPPRPGKTPPHRCVPLYGKGKTCCPTAYSCKDDDTQTNNVTQAFTCKYGGQEYVEGEQIYPEEYPCFKCSCNSNFTGLIDTKSCEEINCGMSIYYQHQLANQCKPKYYENLEEGGGKSCCPIAWDCPSIKLDDDYEGAEE